jgi:hypothetical protein
MTPTPTKTSMIRSVTGDTSTGIFNNGVLYGCLVTMTAQEYTDKIASINQYHLLQIPKDDRTAWLVVIYASSSQITSIVNSGNFAIINNAKEARALKEFDKLTYIKQSVLDYLTVYTQ